MVLTGGVWSIGGMVLTGGVEHWWNGTDRGVWGFGGMVLTGVVWGFGGMVLTGECGALVEWY
jgi:hypothetical protein